MIDLKSAKKLSAVKLVTSTPGMTLQVYGANTKTAPASITDKSWVPISHSLTIRKRRARIALKTQGKAYTVRRRLDQRGAGILGRHARSAGQGHDQRNRTVPGGLRPGGLARRSAAPRARVFAGAAERPPAGRRVRQTSSRKAAISFVRRSGRTRSSTSESASISRAFGISFGEHPGVGERVDRVAAVAEDQRRRRERAALVAVRSDAAEEQALHERAARARVPGATRRASRSCSGEPAGAESRASRARRTFMTGSPKVTATSIGVNASALPSRPLSSTGISSTRPRRRSGWAEATSSAGVGAERGAHHDRLLDAEVVHQRDDLLARRRPSSSATCRAGGPSGRARAGPS